MSKMSYMTVTKITEEKGENHFETWLISNYTQIKNNIIKCLSNSCSKHAAAQNNKQRHI